MLKSMLFSTCHRDMLGMNSCATWQWSCYTIAPANNHGQPRGSSHFAVLVSTLPVSQTAEPEHCLRPPPPVPWHLRLPSMPAAWLPTDWLWTPCGGHHLVGEGPESFAQMIVIKTKPSVSVSIKDGAAGTGATIMYHQQAPAPSTSALRQGQALELSHHQAPTPSTSDKHQHESPAQGTFSRHQHEAPARDTNTLHQQQAPASSTSTKHQDPRGWVATRARVGCPPARKHAKH